MSEQSAVERWMKPERHLLVLVLAFVSVLPACGRAELDHDDEDAEQARSDQRAREAVAKTPPIHIKQTVTWQGDGESSVADDYRHALARCYKEQESPIVPLPEDVVEKLGVSYYEAWYQGARATARNETWNYTFDLAPSSTCVFKVLHTSDMVIDDPDDARWFVDLIKGEGSFTPADGIRRRPIDRQSIEDLKHQMSAALRRAGMDVPAEVKDPREGVVTVAGEECFMTFSDEYKYCLWTRGEQWGLSLIMLSFPPNKAALALYLGGFALEAQGINGPSYHLTTQLITVGESFDQRVFSVPHGIKLTPADGNENNPESESGDGDSDGDEDSNEDE